MVRSFTGRREDQRMLTGKGLYAADHFMNGETRGVFLRSDQAHARIVGINVSAAAELKGFIGILTGEDIVAAGLKSPLPVAFFKGVNGSSLRIPYRPALAHGRVRFSGEAVALVVAETEAIAQDAAELVVVEYESLPAVVDPATALDAATERLHEEFPDNLAIEFEYGNRVAAEGAFSGAAHVAKVSVVAQRIAGNPIEPKSCCVGYNENEDTFDICMPSQGISDLKTAFAHVTGLKRDQFKIWSQDVGGGFGVRNEVYPEFIAVLWAAKKFGRPVKWVGTRSESISGDHHGRAATLTGELALDAKGKFLGLRVDWLVEAGAYCSNAGPLINTASAPVQSATSLYAVPAVFGSHKLVFTNTTPTTAYRGAGRPNVAYLWERLVEEAARVTGIDSVKLRFKNALKRDQFPFKTPTGFTYDSADPTALLQRALAGANWAGFEARRKQAAKRGQLRGIGCALFIEPSGTAGQEEVHLKFGLDGRLSLFSNAGPSGQGHETAFPDLVAKILGVSADKIELRFNDTNVPLMSGTGTYGSRSLICHGTALATGAKEVIRKAQDLAAKELEVHASDIVFDDGTFKVAGTDLAVSMKAIIEKYSALPERSLDSSAKIDAATAFPSGAHVAEVEIDPETGVVKILNYVAADDCGTVYNPALVEGQLYGGLMQGFGQVMGEHVRYDAEGQLVSGSFMDYFMPRANILPEISLIDMPVPSPANILGAKGAGEAGATGAVPTLANAVLNALKPLGINKLDMPFTSSRVWHAIQEAQVAVSSHGE